MRQLRAVLVTAACVAGGVLVTGGATHAEDAPSRPLAEGPAHDVLTTPLPAIAAGPPAPAESTGPAESAGPAGSAPAASADLPGPAESAPPAGFAPADSGAATGVPSAVDAESAVPVGPVPAGPAYSEPDAPSYADPGARPDPALAAPPVPAYAQPVATGVQLHHAPVQATAIRHVATPTQPASDDSQDPMIDKAMILLVGWVMFLLLGGSALAGSATTARR